MKWINYHHLIYFKEIATSGSIAKASDVLKVGQPALSSQLKSLEEYLGVKLFERRNRKLVLTEPGKMTLEYAKKISELGQELIEVVEDKVFTSHIHLSVGALDSVPKHLICDLVDLAHKKTGCFLSILESSFDSLLHQLLSHQIEVIITDQEYNNHEHQNLFSKRIMKCPVVACASPKFKDLRKKFPQSLNNSPCIVPTRHSRMRKEIEIYFQRNEIKPKVIAETQDTSLQKILAQREDGVIFLPAFTTKELIQDKKLVKIGSLENVYTQYFLVYSKRIIENPALDLIIKQDFEKMR